MGLLKSVKKAVNKVSDAVGFTNTTTGIAKLIKDVTGISAADQYATGGTAGFLTMLGGNLSNDSFLGSLFGSSDGSSGGLLNSILGSVVKGAVGIGADYFSNQQQYKQQTSLNDVTFQQNRQLADEAYQRDVAMWNMQNAYNTPAQQMQRLKQAGLNPNLVYGSGNTTGNTAGSPPSYPQVTYPESKATKLDLARNLLGIFNDYQSIKNQALENQRENIRLMLQGQALALQDKRADAQLSLAMSNLDLRRQQFNYAKSHPQSWIGKNYEDIKSIGSDILDGLGIGNGISAELF